MYRKMNNIMRGLTYCIVMTLTLTACGGGNSNNNASAPGIDETDGWTPASTLTGVFFDSPVQGLTYETNTTNGITNANGEFTYQAGEYISFKLYGNLIGTVAAGDIITPMDLQNETHNQDYFLNITRLFLTLDTDGDTTTLQLPNAENSIIDFDQKTEDFEIDPAVTSFVQANANTSLVGAADARAHLAISISNNAGDYVINLDGKSAVSLLRSSRCLHSVGGLSYEFSPTTVSGEIADIWNETCGLEATPTPFSEAYDNRADAWYNCENAPICTYEELNRTYSGLDADNREVEVLISHRKGSNGILVVKQFVATGRESRELIAFSHESVMDFNGRTAQSIITSSKCNPDKTQAGYTYQIEKTTVDFSGTDGFNSYGGYDNCTLAPTETGTIDLTKIGVSHSFPFDCNDDTTCTFTDLNKVVTGIDPDDRPFVIRRLHVTGSIYITQIKESKRSGSQSFSETIISLH
ncbi:hypothetical protein [Zhongshania borealis]|uniref:Carboxypeptidase regulatory-like domain-containing protein n=1 Tax=Zhongshania borealis TaxID=889488 RepID=A0ABP7WZN6_9GAMM